MARVSPLMVIPPLVFAGLAVLFYSGMGRDDSLPSAREGKPAPELALSPLPGKTVLEDAALRAEGVKLVNFWASWCAPCRVEHAQLVELGEEGVTVLGINFKDDPDKAVGFLNELGDPYAAIGADAEGRNALEWGVYGVPETYVLDGNGRIVLRFAGPITKSILESTIRPALRDATE